MYDSGIQALSDLLCEFSLIQQIKHQLAGGAGIPYDIIIIRKALIAHMMIDAQRMFRCFKISGSLSQSTEISAVQRDKQIMRLTLRIVADDLIGALQKFENIRNRLQIKRH